MRKFLIMVPALIVLAFVPAACRSEEAAVTVNAVFGAKLSVTLIGSGGEVIGHAQLTQMSQGVHIHIEAAGLVPGKHGFHIHESASCEPPNFRSAGGHFNPTNKRHGFQNPKGPHAGDLPNLFVRTDGTVKADVIARYVTLEKGKPNSLLKPGGTSLIIHAEADDYITDPTGNSGARIACGPIEPDKE